MTMIFQAIRPTVMRVVALAVAGLAASTTSAQQCTPAEANAAIQKYYNNFQQWLKLDNSDDAFMYRRQSIYPLIAEKSRLSDDAAWDFNFPNEPYRLFGIGVNRPKLEKAPYFNPFDTEKYTKSAQAKERGSGDFFTVSMDVNFGPVKQVRYYYTFADDPDKRDIKVDYFQMAVKKTYHVTHHVVIKGAGGDTEVKADNTRDYTFHDTTMVRSRDLIITYQRNECGGHPAITQENSHTSNTTNSNSSSQQNIPQALQQDAQFEAMLALAQSVHEDKQYERAFQLYLKTLLIKETSMACFQLGVMMYDQWKGRQVYDPTINSKQAGKRCVNLMKRAWELGEPHYSLEGKKAYYNLMTRD